MSEMEDKLQKLLSDPQSLAKAMSMVNSFMSPYSNNESMSAVQPVSEAAAETNAGENTSADMPQMSNDALPKMLNVLSSMGGGGSIDNRKLNLLMSMKPFLGSSHQKSIEHAVSLVKIARTAQVTLKTLPKGLK